MPQLAKYTVEINLYADWIEHLRQELLRLGLTVRADANGFDICKMFFNLRWRRITLKPRFVFTSREFQCPTEQIQGLREFREKVEQGEDLNPHLGGRQSGVLANDLMLNDWGIHHFHLGTKLEPDGFVNRTGPVLFARVTSDAVYFIDVKEHGGKANRTVWTKKEIMEIVHRNWPESLAQYQSGFINMSSKLTEEQHLQFRTAGLLAALEMNDGTIYHSPGGGYMSSGTSVHIAMTYNQNANRLEQTEKKLKASIETIAVEIFKVTGYDGNTFEFKLGVVRGKFIAVEQNSRARLELFDVYDFTSN